MLTAHSNALNDPRRFRGLLADYFPQEPMAVNLLFALYNMDIVREIAAAPAITDAFVFRYQKRLTEEHGISPENARRAVLAWCSCYGRELLGKPWELTPPSVEAVPPSQGRATPASVPGTGKDTTYNDLFQYLPIPGGWAVTGFSGGEQSAIILPTHRQGEPILEIAPGAFAGSRAQQAVMIGGLERIGSKAFRGCGELRQVVFPSTLREMGEQAFQDCARLTGVLFPPSLESLGAGAFAGTAVRNLLLPPSVTCLGEEAFARCSQLAAAQLPANLTELPDRLFFGCQSLTKVTLPAGLTAIGTETFAGCAALREISVPTSVQKIATGAFDDTHPNFVLHCEKGSPGESYARDNRIPFQIIL